MAENGEKIDRVKCVSWVSYALAILLVVVGMEFPLDTPIHRNDGGKLVAFAFLYEGKQKPN